uniref:Neurotransmitter-gated ion-channel ligand-binding domain-containing protein n=1 Tax=Plectus sambesii TaxID=2011161 RepID=A0A914WC27_9BILA
MYFFGGLLLQVFVCFTSALQESNLNSSAERRLRDELLQGYDKNLRPLKDPKRALKVSINPSISGITKADEIDQSLKFFQWFPMVWHDEHLEWDPENYDGIKYLLLPSELLWIPDVFAFTM